MSYHELYRVIGKYSNHGKMFGFCALSFVREHFHLAVKLYLLHSYEMLETSAKASLASTTCEITMLC